MYLCMAFALACVPGLLQTERYAREVLRLGQPWCTAEEIEGSHKNHYLW
ncbi:Scr1 family TA system antitoxin-like transcriptional regulator [Streptomyces coelicoflavus]